MKEEDIKDYQKKRSFFLKEVQNPAPVFKNLRFLIKPKVF
jgi:hypothetical protein